MDLQVTADAVIANGSFLTTDSLGAGRARDLRLTAGSLHLDNAFSRLQVLRVGDGGNVGVNVGTLRLTGGAQISTSTDVGSVGHGGELAVLATDAITIAGHGSFGRSGLFSNAIASGDAGRLLVSAPLLSMDNGLIQAGTGRGSSGHAGDIEVRAGRLTLTGGAAISSATFGSGRGGTLTVAATDAITIAGPNSGLFGGRLSISAPFLTMDGGLLQTIADQGGHGNVGGLDVRVRRLMLAGGAAISSSTTGANRGGDVIIVATDAMTLAGGATIGSVAGGSGDGGNIIVSAGTSVSISGRQGAPTGIVSGTTASSRGNAGGIQVEAGTLTLTENALIGSIAQGSGDGGNIAVSARESVSISGRQAAPSGIVSFAAGDPGKLSISAPALTIEGGLVGTPSAALGGFVGGRGGDTAVRADNLTLRGGAQINSSTHTDNDGGSISLETGRVTISGGAEVLSSTFGAGRGGTVTVTATDEIAITGRGSGLFSQATGRGDAGRVSISTPLLTMDAGVIRANTLGDGDAGNIELRGGRLTLTGGAIIDSGTSGMGRGGDVTVDANDEIAITGSGSGLFSNTFSSGDAGRLAVSAPLLSMDNGLIQASTGLDSSGHAGDIEVRAGRLTLTGGAEISSATFGGGHGGTLTVAATDAITIAGRNAEGFAERAVQQYGIRPGQCRPPVRLHADPDHDG